MDLRLLRLQTQHCMIVIIVLFENSYYKHTLFTLEYLGHSLHLVARILVKLFAFVKTQEKSKLIFRFRCNCDWHKTNILLADSPGPCPRVIEISFSKIIFIKKKM